MSIKRSHLESTDPSLYTMTMVNSPLVQCPLAVRMALDLEQATGFGFQSSFLSDEDKDDGRIIFAGFSMTPEASEKLWASRTSPFSKQAEDDALASYLRDNTQSKTVKVEDYLAHKFLSIHYTEWECIPLIFQAMLLRCEFNIWPHIPTGKLQCTFHPGDTFSWEQMELKTITNFRHHAALLTTNRDNGLIGAFNTIGCPQPWLYHWNWHTQQGKDLCAALRHLLGMTPNWKRTPVCRYLFPTFDEICQKYHILHRGQWSAYEPSNHKVGEPITIKGRSIDKIERGGLVEQTYCDDDPSIEVLCTQTGPILPIKDEESKTLPQKPKKEDADDDNDMIELCMICMERPPNTLVLPCQHCVVCKECSEKLGDTPVAKKCVRCMRSITSILHDEIPPSSSSADHGNGPPAVVFEPYIADEDDE